MWRPVRLGGVLLVVLLAFTSTSAGQTFDTVGTRAQGMAGAFVGVADDASAVYWNPGGLAQGAYFSLVLDGSMADGSTEADSAAGRRSSWILALSTPALGLSYYRLRSVAVRPPPLGPPEVFQLDSLVTHHAGLTVVHSLADGVAVGATAKLVRGLAGSGITTAERAGDLLEGWDILGRSTNKVDLDLGIMASGPAGSIGLTVRNITEPSFDTAGDLELQLERQIRAGASVLLLPAWKLAADLDLTRNQGPLGEVRQLSIGTESRLTRRFTARGGIRLNATGDHGRMPAWSLGASYAVFGSLLMDAHATAGADEALRGWGVAGRVVF